MNNHLLKITPEYFLAVDSGQKNFELRENDRDYKVGDMLVLREWKNSVFTGHELMFEISYILKDAPEYGLKHGYVILGFVL